MLLADIEKAKKQLEEKLISFEKKHDRTIDDFKKNNSKIEKRADEHDKKNADLETILETVLARLTSLESQHADLETRYKTLLSEHKALQKAYLELKTTVNFSSRKQEKLESCSDTTQQAVVLETDKKKVVVEQTYKMFTDQLLEVMKQSSTKNDETIHEIFPSFISIISDLSEIMNLDDVRKLQYITLDEIKKINQNLINFLLKITVKHKSFGFLSYFAKNITSLGFYHFQYFLMDCTANPLVNKKMDEALPDLLNKENISYLIEFLEFSFKKITDQQEPTNSILMSLDVLNDFQKIIMERKKNNPTQEFLDESLSMIVNAKKIFTDKIPAPKKNELKNSVRHVLNVCTLFYMGSYDLTWLKNELRVK